MIKAPRIDYAYTLHSNAYEVVIETKRNLLRVPSCSFWHDFGDVGPWLAVLLQDAVALGCY